VHFPIAARAAMGLTGRQRERDRYPGGCHRRPLVESPLEVPLQEFIPKNGQRYVSASATLLATTAWALRST